MSIEKVEGTIAKVLTDHKDELFELIGQGKIRQARDLAIKLMDDESLQKNSARLTAKNLFTKTPNNLFLSCLMTYMTGSKVS